MSRHPGAENGMPMGDGSSSTANATIVAQQLMDALTLEGGSQFLTAIIALSMVNMASALAMIGNILYDAWTVRRWDFETKRDKYFGWLMKIHPAEMFPLILSMSIILQAIVFISVQSSNTTPILFDGCGRIVQLIFPALWLPFSTMLIFGLETTFRSLRRVRFPSRNRWHIPTAIVVIALTIFSAWAATNVFPTRGKCLTGLIWWTARYAKLAVVLAVGLLVMYPASALIITVQLVKTVKVEKAERIAATRVVYYLVVNTWLIALVLPYHIQILMGVSALRTAQIAQVALSITGIINLIMHIFLRSNADRLAIRAVETPWSDKRTIRVFGPSDLNIREHISYPVLWQEVDYDHNSFAVKSEKGSQRSLTDSDFDAWSASGPLQHVVFPSLRTTSKQNRPLTPPLKIEPVRKPTLHNSSYSLFPTIPSAASQVSSNTAYGDTSHDLDLPLPPAPLFARKHDRSTSAESSATVKIGLRLSYMNHALDPIEASPPSNIDLPMLLGDSDRSTDDDNWSKQGLTRASASSETLRGFEFLRPQAYKEAPATPYQVVTEPHVVMPYSSEHLPPKIGPQQQVAPTEPILLPHQTFVAPRPAPVPPSAPILAAVIAPPSHPLAVPQLPPHSSPPKQFKQPQAVFSLQSINRPQPPFPTQPVNKPIVSLNTQVSETFRADFKPKPRSPAKPHGLPSSPKPAPSWRPQNWKTSKDNRSNSPKTETHEDKALPNQKALPAVPSATQADQPASEFNNPYDRTTPPTITRPPGWK